MSLYVARTGSGEETCYSRGVPLEYFLQELFGEDHYKLIKMSTPDNLAGGETFGKAFKGANIRFTHIVRAADDEMVSTRVACAAAVRGMAIQCRLGQGSIDVVVPVVLDVKGGDGKLREATMSGILISIKDRLRAGSKASVAIDEAVLHRLWSARQASIHRTRDGAGCTAFAGTRDSTPHDREQGQKIFR